MERRDAAEGGEAVLRHAREGGALEADPVRRLARLVRQACQPAKPYRPEIVLSRDSSMFGFGSPLQCRDCSDIHQAGCGLALGHVLAMSPTSKALKTLFFFLAAYAHTHMSGSPTTRLADLARGDLASLRAFLSGQGTHGTSLAALLCRRGRGGCLERCGVAAPRRQRTGRTFPGSADAPSASRGPAPPFLRGWPYALSLSKYEESGSSWL